MHATATKSYTLFLHCWFGCAYDSELMTDLGLKRAENSKLPSMNTSLPYVRIVRIVRYPYEEPYHLHLVITASNARLCGTLEF